MTALPGEVIEASARGWRIHPLRVRSKRPCLKDWQHLATPDIRQIESWARQYPDCNWGAVAGPDSGFFAVDVDVPEGMMKLEIEFGLVPEGLTNVTARGYQLIYGWPQNADVRPATNRPCQGADIRGEDSYIVIPPSVHPSGHVYHYSDDSLPIPPCPAWLLGMILKDSQQCAQDRRGAPAAGAVIEHPHRTPHLVSLAGTMNKRGMDPAAIEAALLAENVAKCSPPLQDAKVRGIARDIPARYPNAPKESGLKLVELGDLLSRPVVPVDWVLRERLAAGSVSIVASKPKVGKSTLARNLALAIARGEPFLGWAVKRGTVLYLALEERSEDVTEDFRALGADGSENILLADTGKASDVVKILRERKPVLLVVDPLFRLLSVKDEKAYAEMYGALGPLIDIARQTGTHILCLHHSSKLAKTEAIDAPIGSTALSGAVSTLLVMKRTETYRTLQTVQRIGEDLPETVLHFDASTKRLSLGGSRERCEAANMAEAIVAALDGKAAAEALTEPEIGDAVEGKTTLKRKVLRELTGQGKIVRLGTGKRGDPYRYASCFLVPDLMKNSENKKLPDRSTDVVLEEPEKVVPGFHTYMGNKGTSNKNSPKGSASIEEKVVSGKTGLHPVSEKNRNKLFAERENVDTSTDSHVIFP